ncbi:hypothetical protein [Actinocorallia libanotica]|uniref:SPW repeat-containing protein n=1 Tax=Actinocorallia libanotica TaxID=46162 RepID=A0ABP4C5D7_9ACTN
MANDEQVAAAQAALRVAARSKAAARERPAAPGWYAPARGLLFMAGFGLVFGPWARPWLIAGLVAMTAFVLVHGAVVNLGGVVVMPKRTGEEWLIDQVGPLFVYGLGWLAAIPFGHAAGAVTAAVLGGAALWAATAWQENRRRS